jgi:hypothetical protein
VEIRDGAAEAKKRRAGFFGYHPPRDKEHQPASPKCRRESTPQTQARHKRLVRGALAQLRGAFLLFIHISRARGPRRIPPEPKRERVIMLEPWDKGLTATTLPAMPIAAAPMVFRMLSSQH